MFPLRDTIPRVHTPWAVWSILALNLAAFLWQQTLTQSEVYWLFHNFGVVPARFSFPDWALAAGFTPGGEVSFLAHMFLHGGWSHFLVNMWTLWIFGDNIEDVMGPWRFWVFYLTCGLAALLTHVFFSPSSTIPVVGASGAIAGVLGAYFLLYPHARVTTLVLLIFLPLVFDLPAVVYLGLWFLVQLLSGLSSLASEGGSGIAWWAHLGGFVAGVLLLPLFRKPERCYFCNPAGPFRRTPQPRA